MRLTGWQRIGMTLSATWIVGMLAYNCWLEWHAATDMPRNLFFACTQTPGHATGFCQAGYRAAIAEGWREAWADFIPYGLALVLAPVALGWSFAYAAACLFRWIARGFRGP